jgi:hypothetical protein
VTRRRLASTIGSIRGAVVPIAAGCLLALAGCASTAIPPGPAQESSPGPVPPGPASTSPVDGSTPGAASPTPGVATSPCTTTDQDRYVYDPGRLIVKALCLRVSGVIDAVRQEADGDLHILVRLDPAFRRYLAPANQGEELGDLVVEPVCVHPVSQLDAVATCAADPDPLQDLPHTGMRVWMEGRYVLDSDHGDWAELHPLYRWGRGPTAAGPGSGPGAAPTSVAGPTGGLRVRLTSVPAPASIGGFATIGARTSAGAGCSVRVTLPSGRISTVAALAVRQVADGSGNVAWTWRVGSTTKPGTATALVSCSTASAAGSATTTFSMR